MRAQRPRSALLGLLAPRAHSRSARPDRLTLLALLARMVDVLDAIPVRFYMDNGQPHTTATYRALLATLQRRTEVTYLAAEPRTLDFGGAEIEVLPLPALGTVEQNDRSVGKPDRTGLEPEPTRLCGVHASTKRRRWSRSSASGTRAGTWSSSRRNGACTSSPPRSIPPRRA